jgi:hypothetical protein
MVTGVTDIMLTTAVTAIMLATVGITMDTTGTITMGTDTPITTITMVMATGIGGTVIGGRMA